ncbi:hypothetical protein ABT140_28770, partial [Streptomyces californicus]|uniref:hypothetical protein n=1 Tax=Streptomyces californicus TaxID=67351 RepID=UPI00332C70E1
PRAVAAEAGVSQEFDLSQCVREPIHLLGGGAGPLPCVRARLPRGGKQLGRKVSTGGHQRWHV